MERIRTEEIVHLLTSQLSVTTVVYPSHIAISANTFPSDPVISATGVYPLDPASHLDQKVMEIKAPFILASTLSVNTSYDPTYNSTSRDLIFAPMRLFSSQAVPMLHSTTFDIECNIPDITHIFNGNGWQVNATEQFIRESI